MALCRFGVDRINDRDQYELCIYSFFEWNMFRMQLQTKVASFRNRLLVFQTRAWCLFLSSLGSLYIMLNFVLSSIIILFMHRCEMVISLTSFLGYSCSGAPHKNQSRSSVGCSIWRSRQASPRDLS